MTSLYGSSGSFVSILRSKYIVQNTYSGRRINFHSKPTPIQRPAQNLTWIIHTREVTSVGYHKQFLNLKKLYQKVRYSSKIIDPVINLFIPNEVRSHFHIYDHSIVKFGIRGLCLWISNTSRVNSLDRFRKSVVNKFKT